MPSNDNEKSVAGRGRPRLFQTVKELDDRAEAYFESCKPTFDGEGKIITPGEPVTAYGLAIACGTTWETLRDYRSGKYDTIDNDFSLAIKWWVEQIKHYAEKGLYNARNAAGPIFHLVNLTRNDGDGAWKNAQQQEIAGANGGPVKFEITSTQASIL